MSTNREAVLSKIAQGNLTIQDLRDPEALQITQEYIEERHPGLLSGSTAKDLLKEPEIQQAIEESVRCEMGK